MYQKKNLGFDDATALSFSNFSGGYKRLIAQKKLDGEISQQEGKSPITFTAYCFLAKQALHHVRDFALGAFAHLFLILCWNLMARSVS
jgi:hypothetical protein